MAYLKFEQTEDVVWIINQEGIRLGCLTKIRVGQWMSWCLLLEDDCYLSASCLDEVREKMRELNAKKL